MFLSLKKGVRPAKKYCNPLKLYIKNKGCFQCEFQVQTIVTPILRESIQVSESGFKSVNLIKNKTVNINDMLFMGTRS